MHPHLKILRALSEAQVRYVVVNALAAIGLTPRLPVDGLDLADIEALGG